jgi:hypothetical protein
LNYITRERIHVDRIATAWAIRTFIDPDATFQFVPRTRDVHRLDGIPFDIRGATLSHRDGRCTFEVLLQTYALEDPALERMARVIHAADLPQDEPSDPLAPGVLAIFDGLRESCQTDQQRLERGLVICGALYCYCKQDTQEEGF